MSCTLGGGLNYSFTGGFFPDFGTVICNYVVLSQGNGLWDALGDFLLHNHLKC